MERGKSMEIMGEVKQELKITPVGMKNKYRLQPPSNVRIEGWVEPSIVLLFSDEGELWNKVRMTEVSSGKVFEVPKKTFSDWVISEKIKIK